MRGENFNPHNPDTMIHHKKEDVAEKSAATQEGTQNDSSYEEKMQDAFDKRMSNLAKKLDIDKNELIHAYALVEYKLREKYPDESKKDYETSPRMEGNITEIVEGKEVHKKELEEEVIRTLEARKASEEDVLMGIPNRRALEDLVKKLYGKIEESKKEMQVEEDRRSKEIKEPKYYEFSMIMIDIDHFKKVNDTHGHGCGDYVLNKVGQALKNNMRGGDFIARYGGEEIVVIAPDSNGSVTEFAERLRKEIEALKIVYTEPKTGKEHDINITISAGVSTFDEKFDTMKQSSDNGLYAAKEGGRNQVQYLDKETGEYAKYVPEETKNK